MAAEKISEAQRLNVAKSILSIMGKSTKSADFTSLVLSGQIHTVGEAMAAINLGCEDTIATEIRTAIGDIGRNVRVFGT